MMIDHPSSYTRKEVMELTGMSAPAFDHATRAGILRATPDMPGSRAHRRFDGAALTLICILSHYWRQGVGPTDLLGVANRFHVAIDWFIENGLVGNEPVAEILIWASEHMSRSGHIAVQRLRQFQSISGDRPLSTMRDGPGGVTKLDWPQLIDLLREDTGFDVPDGLAEACRGLSRSAWDEHALRYFTVSDQPCSLSYVRTLFLFQTRAGHWRDEYEVAPSNAEAFTTVNMVALKKRVFGMKPLPRA